MCKRLGHWLLVATALLGAVHALPVSSFLGDDDSNYYDDSFENEYDVVFDQRQNGTANVHVSVDGVLLALPAPEVPASSAALAGATLLDLFASQLSVANDSEDDVSDELYGGVSSAGSSGTASSSSTTSSTSTSAPSTPTSSSTTTASSTTTTTAATTPATTGAQISNDFAYQSLPASLLGQGLSFLFNTRRGEVPFRVNPDAGEPAIPLLITKVEKAAPGGLRGPFEESLEESSRHVPRESAGKKRRKHKRKYKVRVASMLRPLLRRTAQRQ